MSMQLQSPIEIPRFSDEVSMPISSSRNEIVSIPRTESELAQLRLSLAAAAFERANSLGLDQESAIDQSAQLYKTTEGIYARMRTVRTALDEATADSLQTEPVAHLVPISEFAIETPSAPVIDITAYKQTKQRKHTKPKLKPPDIQALQALELDEDGHIADQAEIEKLIEANMGLVHKWAKRYYGDTLTIDDLIQEGSIGLIKAAQRFKPSKSFAFSTFAERCVKGEILRSIRDKDKIVKGRRDNQSITATYFNAVDELRNNRIEVTDESIVRVSGLTMDQIKEIRERPFINRTSSLDAPFDNGDDASNLRADYYTGGKIDDHEQVMNKQLVEILLKKLGDERMDSVLRARFGIAPYGRPHTQAEIAGVIGVSQMQVSRLIARAFDSLRVIHENVMKDSD